MVQIASGKFTLEEFLQLPETNPASEYIVFTYSPKQEIQVFDQPDNQLPFPAFTQELSLTIEALFNWLLE